MSRTISGLNGQITLNPATDNPTYVTGTISSTATDSLTAPSGANWTITNTGSILDPANAGVSVYFQSANATFINGVTSGGGGYVGAGQFGVQVNGGGPGTVINFATIKANTYKKPFGVELANGGTVTNGSTSVTSALIAAYGTYGTGVSIQQGGAGTVHNFGTIIGNTGTAGGNYGVALGDGGVVVSGASSSTAARIEGADDGIILYGTLATTVVNYGTITGNQLAGIRQAAAVANVTVNNFGTISGPESIAFNGGTNNRLIAHPGAVFQGNEVVNAGGTLTIELATGTGAGTIGGFGSNFQDFETLTVDSGAQWTITGSNTIASGVSLVNSGTLTNAGTLTISGTLTDPGRLINSGTIDNAVTLSTGSYFDNTGKVIVSGGAGVIATGAATIVNSGTIDPPGPGVYLTAGGAFTNVAGGYVGGGAYGVRINSTVAATVTNAGTIAGTLGVYVSGVGTASQTLIDSGTIIGSGGTAVGFGGGNDLLKFTPSTSVAITGTVNGGAGTNTLDFASAATIGTLTGTNADFLNFSLGTVASGARWVLAGTDTIGNTTTLRNAGTLTNAGTLSNIGAIVGAVGADGSGGVGSGNPGGAGTAAIGLTAGSLSNTGAISGGDGGDGQDTVVGGAGGTGGDGLDVMGGTAANDGAISGGDGGDGGGSGVSMGHGGAGGRGAHLTGGTLSNTGTIRGGPGGEGLYGAAGGIGVQASAVNATNLSVIVGGAGGLGAANGSVGGSGGVGAYFVSGSLANSGTITGGFGGLAGSGGNGGAGGSGVYLRSASLTNTDRIIGGAGGLGGGGAGVYGGNGGLGVYVKSGTVTNYGTIIGGAAGIGGSGGTAGIAGAGVFFRAGGTLVNGGDIERAAGRQGQGYSVYFGTAASRLIIDPGASFGGAVLSNASFSNTLELASSASTGTLSGLASNFQGFATYTVDTGSKWVFTGANTIQPGYTLANSGALTVNGTLTNYGTLGSTGTLTDAGSLINNGSITGAVTLSAGAYFHNTGPGKVVVSGGAGVIAKGAATIVNSGTIDPPGPGVYLTAGGVFTNVAAGYVGGGAYGVRINSTVAATVTNAGTIAGTLGLYVSGAGTANQTLIDTGTIIGSGGTAVGFGAGNDLLELTPSSSVAITGTVNGGGGTNTLEFTSAASTGTLTGSNADFVGFGAGTIDTGASWTLAGTDTFASTTTLANSGTLTNYGTLVDAGRITGGITLGISAAVVSLTSTGSISTSGATAVIRGASGTVINSGTITGGSGVAISISGTGSVLNQGSISTGADYTVYSAHGTVTNLGTISNTDSIGFGVRLLGGVIVNGSRGSTGADIYGKHIGAYDSNNSGAGGSVINYGTIIGGNFFGLKMQSHSGANALTNYGTILTGGIFGVGLYSNYTAIGTINNLGLIQDTSSSGYGVYFRDNGTVTNAGTISGGKDGFRVSSGFGAVVINSGTLGGGTGFFVFGSGTTHNQTLIDSGAILGTSGTAAVLGAANDLLEFAPSTSVVVQGTVTGGGGANTLEFASAASIGTLTGLGADFVNFSAGTVASGASWVLAGSNTFASGVTLTNSGTLVDAGTLTNAGTITNQATVAGSSGLSVADGGVVTNAAGGLMFGNNGVLATGGTISVDNLGSIQGGFAGVNLASGTVINGAAGATAASIYGQSYGVVASGAATVTNYGTITASNAIGVSLSAGGSLTNNGIISAPLYGVRSAGPVTITNHGTITAFYGVVGDNAADVVINSGTITGSKFGIDLILGGTIIDSGTIGGGGAAVAFNSGASNLLVLENGYKLNGQVISSGGSSTLELLGTSSSNSVTVHYNALTLSRFGTVAFAPGAGNYARLTIDNGGQLPGTITNFTGPHDQILLDTLSDLNNDATTSFNTLTNVLTVTGDNGSLQLQLGSGNYSGISWTTQESGAGTLVVPQAEAVVVSSAAIQPSSGAFDAGHALAITLTMSGAVTVTGTPTLSLNDGGVASYDAAQSTSTALVFDYTVASGQNTAALAATSVSLSGGATIFDGNNNAASLTLPASATFTGVEIDTTAPTAVDNKGVSPGVGQIALIPASALQFTDNLSSDAQETYTITSAPANGTLLRNGSPTSSFTQADIDNGLLSYQETNVNGSSDSFAFTVTDAAGNTTAVQQFALQISPVLLGTGLRFVGAGRSGAASDNPVLQNSNGTPTLWTVGSGGTSQVTLEPNPGPSWQIAALGDLNSDGSADLLFQYSDGTPAVWLMNGTTIANSAALPNPGPGWSIEASGDFYDTGHDNSILWQSTGGVPAIWEMNGASIANSAALPNPGSSWSIVGTGDFFDTGYDNTILWQNTGGLPVLWQMNGGTIANDVALPNPGPGWSIRAEGNFSGDGHNDSILLQNANGLPVLWQLNGGTVANAVALPNPGPNWTILGTGAVAGNGLYDIFFQNTNGLTAEWSMNGSTLLSSNFLTSNTLTLNGPSTSVTGSGGETITLNAANQTFIDGSTVYNDTVVGFSQGSGDRIHLTTDTVTDALAHTTQVNGGQDTQISLSDGSAILLKGVTSINSNFFS